METVKDWLCKNGLGEYCMHFEGKGWDEMTLLPEMTYADIEQCIKKRGHIVKFKKAVENYVRSSSTAKDTPTIVYKRTNDTGTQVGAEGFMDNYEPLPTSPDAELGTHRHAFADASHGSDDIVTPYHSLRLKVDEEEFHTGLSTAVALPTNKTEDLSSDTSVYVNDRNHSLAVISSLNTTACFDAEVSSQPTVNLTIIKNSEHTNVSTEPAQIITEPCLSESATDNLKGQMEAVASWHAKRDARFVETNTMKEVQEVLEDNYWVTILGKPGEGKTAMAAHLMLKYKQKGYEPIFLSAVSDWKLLVAGGKSKQFVVIDDMFGTAYLDRIKVNEWLSWLGYMCKIVEVQKGNKLVVCTNRQYIFDDIKSELEKFNSFRADQIVNLSSKMYTLTPKEKLEIYNAYADENTKVKNEDEMKALDPPHGFPHCVIMFHTNVYLRRKGMSFFRNPSKYVRREISNFKDNDRAKFLVLLIVLLSNNQLKPETLNEWLCDNTVLQKNVIQHLGISSDKLVDISKNLNLLEGTYIERGPDDCYSFTHESLLENVAYVFASAHASLAMEVLDLKYVISFFRQSEAKDAQKFEADSLSAVRKQTLRLNFNQKFGSIKPLAKRLAKEVKIGNLFTVSMCDALRDQMLLKEWISYISTEPEEVLQAMFCYPANILDNLLLSLTQFSRDDAVLFILQNASILNKLKSSAGWMKALQVGLERSFLEKDSILFEAFANAAHFKKPSCRLQGSELLMKALQNGTSKYAMVLIRETKIDPHYKDRYNRGYFHYLVKARIADEVFEKMFDLLSDLGTDINSKDLIGVSPLEICISMVNWDNTREVLDMAVDRFLYLLTRGTRLVVKKKDCYSLLEKVGIPQFYERIAKLKTNYLTPALQNVPVLDLFPVDLTNMVENTCHIFVKVLTGILEKTNMIRAEETENMPAPYQVNCSSLQNALMDVCNKHLRLSLQQCAPEDLDLYHRFTFTDREIIDIPCLGLAPGHASSIHLLNTCKKDLKCACKDILTESEHSRCEVRSALTKQFKFLQLQPPLQEKIHQLALQDLYTDDLTYYKSSILRYNAYNRLFFEGAALGYSRLNYMPFLVESVCRKTMEKLLKSVWKEACDSENLKLAVLDVYSKHLQLALEAVCIDIDNLSLMKSLSTAESKNSLDKLNRYYNAIARMERVDVLGISVAGESLHVENSQNCNLGDTLGYCCKLISTIVF